MTEQELERLAAKLGARPAEAIDPDRIAERVLARLEEARDSRDAPVAREW